MGLITKICIRLTEAQLQLARQLIDEHASIGDCERRGYELEFGDYEGANAFLRGVYGLGVGTTRAFLSAGAISRKLEAAIVEAAEASKAELRVKG